MSRGIICQPQKKSISTLDDRSHGCQVHRVRNLAEETCQETRCQIGCMIMNPEVTKITRRLDPEGHLKMVSMVFNVILRPFFSDMLCFFFPVLGVKL